MFCHLSTTNVLTSSETGSVDQKVPSDWQPSAHMPDLSQPDPNYSAFILTF